MRRRAEPQVFLVVSRHQQRLLALRHLCRLLGLVERGTASSAPLCRVTGRSHVILWCKLDLRAGLNERGLLQPRDWRGTGPAHRNHPPSHH